MTSDYGFCMKGLCLPALFSVVRSQERDRGEMRYGRSTASAACRNDAQNSEGRIHPVEPVYINDPQSFLIRLVLGRELFGIAR